MGEWSKYHMAKIMFLLDLIFYTLIVGNKILINIKKI